MPIENRVARLEQERRERAWIRVMRKYPQVSADEVDEIIAVHLLFKTWSAEQLEAYAATSKRPDGVSLPEGL